MTSLASRVMACVPAVAVVALAPFAAWGQREIAVVGIVRLADGQDAGDVQVQGLLAGRPGVVRSPAREIYLYMVPTTEQTILLTFGRPGYEMQALTVRLEPGRFVSRVSDIVLTSTSAVSLDSSSGDDGSESDDALFEERSAQRRLREHLESQAAIAARAGSTFVAIFRWNLAEYRHRLAQSRVLTRELETFSRDPRHEAIASPVRNPEIEVYGKLIEARATGRTSLAPGVALDVARDRRRPSPIRAAAADAMMNMRLSEQNRTALLGVLRESATSSRSPALLASAFTGLAKIGADSDRVRVIRATQSQDVDQVRAAISAIDRTRIVDADSAVAGVIRTNPSAEVRAVVIEDLGRHLDTAGTPRPAATQATADALAKDTAAVVRMQAVQVLGAVSTSDASSATARRALEAAAADTSRVEVRGAARRVLRRPPR